MLTYHLTDIFSIMFDKNLNMTTFKCFGNVMCLQGDHYHKDHNEIKASYQRNEY